MKDFKITEVEETGAVEIELCCLGDVYGVGASVKRDNIKFYVMNV